MTRVYRPYAKVETIWHDDPRCRQLPDNDTRWLYICLWLEAVEARSSILPERFTPQALASMCHIPIDRIQHCLRALAMQKLIGVTEKKGGGQLVIPGVREKHISIQNWKRPMPNTYYNPWKDTSYEWNPSALDLEVRINGESDEQKQEIDPQEIDPLENHPILKKEFNRLRLLLKKAHPTRTIKLSEPGTKKYYRERLELDRLVRLDGENEQTIVAVLEWVLTDENAKQAEFWRSNCFTLGNVRNVCKSGLTKFAHMKRDWATARSDTMSPEERDAKLKEWGLE